MLERSAARYVDVTLLDVTECDDTTVLADRIMERMLYTLPEERPIIG
jgi:hypothetical protein